MIRRAAEFEVGLVDADEALTVRRDLADPVGRDILAGWVVGRAEPNEASALGFLRDRVEIEA